MPSAATYRPSSGKRSAGVGTRSSPGPGGAASTRLPRVGGRWRRDRTVGTAGLSPVESVSPPRTAASLPSWDVWLPLRVCVCVSALACGGQCSSASTVLLSRGGSLSPLLLCVFGHPWGGPSLPSGRESVSPLTRGGGVCPALRVPVFVSSSFRARG